MKYVKGEENLSLSILKGLLLKCFEEVKGYTEMTGRPPFLLIYSYEEDI